MLTFDNFKKMATDDQLQLHEKVGFADCHRLYTEENIFEDILNKLSISSNQTVKIMDIGCGCSKPVLMLIDYARKMGYHLYLVDSKEMLDNLPNESFITKINGEFPFCEELHKLKSQIDYIIVYSVLHHVVTHSNYIGFIDSAIELLNNDGKLLIGDLPNISKKKRFLDSENGIKFHQEWSKNEDLPNITWNNLEKSTIDDSLIFSILQRYRSMGCETYLLEQKDGLPMNKTREDILIKRN